MQARNVLVIGATSAIAEATCRELARRVPSRFFLVARHHAHLDSVADDLAARIKSDVGRYVMDTTDYDRHDDMIRSATSFLGSIDVAIVAYGHLPDQKLCEASATAMLAEFDVNALSAIALLTRLANLLAGQGSGMITAISSVAGDRGRKSNYAYGAAKGALTVFLQGLRHRLHANGVRVLTVKPGFVDTPMTESFKKGGPLWATPERVAKDIARAIEGPGGVLYTPWFWRWIMAVIVHIPEIIFVRSKL